MGPNERATQRVEAWVRAQLGEQQDQRMDQGQQPQQGGGQGNQQAQRVQHQPRPIYQVLGPEVQQRFRQVMYRALHMVIPQARQQPVTQQYQPQGQPQFQQPIYQAQRQQQRQQQQQQTHQQQVQQQQAQLLRQPQQQPQHQPQTQSKHNQEKEPTPFSTDRAHYNIIRRIADSTEGAVSLARSTPKSSSSSTAELRVVKSVGSNGSDPREAHMLYAAGSHPNVLRIFECAWEAPSRMAHMCMEYCNGGDLHELLCTYDAQFVPVPEPLILKAVVDISDGLAFLHGGWVRNEGTGFYQIIPNAPRIIHRDMVSNFDRYPSIMANMLRPYTENYQHFRQAQRRWRTSNIRPGRFWASILCFGSRNPDPRRNSWIPSTGVRKET